MKTVATRGLCVLSPSPYWGEVPLFYLSRLVVLWPLANASRACFQRPFIKHKATRSRKFCNAGSARRRTVPISQSHRLLIISNRESTVPRLMRSHLLDKLSQVCLQQTSEHVRSTPVPTTVTTSYSHRLLARSCRALSRRSITPPAPSQSPAASQMHRRRTAVLRRRR